MKQLTFLLIASISYPLAMVPVDAQELAAPTTTIGSSTVESGFETRIPIILDNHRDFIALQFDLAFEPSMFDEVDTSRCFSQLPKSGFLADCRCQDPPNDDIVRFVVFGWNFEPIPSGVLGYLGFRAAADAPSGVTPLSALECTGLGISSDQQTSDLTLDDYEPGEITIFGTGPPTPPEVPTTVLDFDGVPVFTDNPFFSSQAEHPRPDSGTGFRSAGNRA